MRLWVCNVFRTFRLYFDICTLFLWRANKSIDAFVRYKQMSFGHILNVGEFRLNEFFFFCMFLFYCHCLELIANAKNGQRLISELYACQLDYPCGEGVGSEDQRSNKIISKLL